MLEAHARSAGIIGAVGVLLFILTVDDRVATALTVI
jgi:hypothetical protein